MRRRIYVLRLTLLLGQVWVVKDREAARRLVRSFRLEGNHSAGAKVVTLGGEVFFASGPIQAGQEGKPGTLSRPRQRRELTQSLEELETRIKELDDQLTTFR